LELKLEQTGVQTEVSEQFPQELRGVTSLLELVSRVEAPAEKKVNDPAEETSRTQYIDLEEGA
jgi:hypothetical protein